MYKERDSLRDKSDVPVGDVLTMRDELKKLYFEARVPDEGDLSDTIWVAKNLDRGRHELALKHQREAEKESKTDEELWIVADDIHYYAFKESFLIWHFCLWRLQALTGQLSSILQGSASRLIGKPSINSASRIRISRNFYGM